MSTTRESGSDRRARAHSADVASERTAEPSRIVLSRLEEFRDVPEVRSLLDSAA